MSANPDDKLTMAMDAKRPRADLMHLAKRIAPELDTTATALAMQAVFDRANKARDEGKMPGGTDIAVAAIRAYLSALEPSPSAERVATIRAGLEAAKDLAKTMEGLTGCRSDDDYVWGAQEKIEAALAALTNHSTQGDGK